MKNKPANRQADRQKTDKVGKQGKGIEVEKMNKSEIEKRKKKMTIFLKEGDKERKNKYLLTQNLLIHEAKYLSNHQKTSEEEKRKRK